MYLQQHTSFPSCLQSTAKQCRHPLQTLHLDPFLHLQTQALVMSLPKPQLHSQLIMAGKGHSDGSPSVLKAVCEVDQCYVGINFLVHSFLLLTIPPSPFLTSNTPSSISAVGSASNFRENKSSKENYVARNKALLWRVSPTNKKSQVQAPASKIKAKRKAYILLSCQCN